MIDSLIGVNLLITLIISPILIGLLITIKAREKFFLSKHEDKSKLQNQNSTESDNLEKKQEKAAKIFSYVGYAYVFFGLISIPLISPLLQDLLDCENNN